VTQKVILIDGDRLPDLMIQHDIGVSTSHESVKQSAHVTLASSGQALAEQWPNIERTAKQVKIPVKR